MKVKISKRSQGLHPSEVVVTVRTTDGDQSLVVDRRSILQGDFLAIGFPVGEEGQNSLVELPRETSTGCWRVWVDKTQTEHEPERRFS
jgi:hypothetical protein